MKRRLTAGLLAGALLWALPAAAQNTGGVFGPTVNDGHRSAQYRAAYDFDTHAFAQRAHYQQAINGDLMWRVLVQARKTADSNVDADFIQGELFWQLSNPSRNWQHALRLDVRYRTEGRPGVIGLHWTNQFDLGEDWIARFVLLTATELGNGASGDLVMQTRAMIAYSINPTLSAGVEMFNTYGPIDDFPTLQAQDHQIGPVIAANLNSQWRLLAGVLFGMSKEASDAQGRVWMTHRF